MPVCSKTKKNVEDSENALKRLGLLAAIVRGFEAVQKGRVVSNREAMRRLKKTAFGWFGN